MKKAPKTGLTKKHWFGYMFGDWGGCMTFALMGSLFTMYCTNALGVDPTLLGTLVIIWTIWDAINDPMMGALMDKAFAKRFGKEKIDPCPYLTTGMDGHRTAGEWSELYRRALEDMGARARRLPLEKLIRIIESIKNP